MHFHDFISAYTGVIKVYVCHIYSLCMSYFSVKYYCGIHEGIAPDLFKLHGIHSLGPSDLLAV